MFDPPAALLQPFMLQPPRAATPASTRSSTPSITLPSLKPSPITIPSSPRPPIEILPRGSSISPASESHLTLDAQTAVKIARAALAAVPTLTPAMSATSQSTNHTSHNVVVPGLWMPSVPEQASAEIPTQASVTEEALTEEETPKKKRKKHAASQEEPVEEELLKKRQNTVIVAPKEPPAQGEPPKKKCNTHTIAPRNMLHSRSPYNLRRRKQCAGQE